MSKLQFHIYLLTNVNNILLCYTDLDLQIFRFLSDYIIIHLIIGDDSELYNKKYEYN